MSDLRPNGPGALLRAARSDRGVTLEEASGALRIPVRILAALEDDDPSGLPPKVYVVGLLRNYARYLGIDPAVAATHWAGAWAPEADRGEQPGSTAPHAGGLWGRAAQRLRAWRHGIVARRIVGAGGAGVVLGLTGLFLIAQLVRFAAPPALLVASPASESTTVREGSVGITFSGRSAPNIRIRVISGAGAVLATTSDETGSWRIDVPLSIGANQVSVQAEDPATGATSGEPIHRVLYVPRPVGAAPALRFDEPSPDAVVADAAVALLLRTEPSTPVTVTATQAGVPQPTVAHLVAAADGSVRGSLLLPAGTWALSASAGATGGAQSNLTRVVTVRYSGVTVVLTGTASSTWIRAWTDGVVDPQIGPIGRTMRAGDSVTVAARREVEIRFGSAPDVGVVVNGRILGPLGRAGVPSTWRFAHDGSATPSARR